MYIHNAYESQAVTLGNNDLFMDRLKVPKIIMKLLKSNRKHLNFMSLKDRLDNSNIMVWQHGFVLEQNQKKTKYT
jgi:hypothetical protein